MDLADQKRAEKMRARLERGDHDCALFRGELLQASPLSRDAWLDCALGLTEVAEDGPSLPAGCVPYLPCSVDALLRVADAVSLNAGDVVVDVGCGVGRAAAFFHLVSGAAVVGIEIQPALFESARSLSERAHLKRASWVEGNAANLLGHFTNATLFFLYCPFSGERLTQALEGIKSIARQRAVYVACVDLPLPPCAWLSAQPGTERDVAIYRSVLPE